MGHPSEDIKRGEMGGSYHVTREVSIVQFHLGNKT
jgi:hypothetical protein